MSESIRIDKIDAETVQIPILGTSPLIVNKFSEKAKRKMLDAMQGRKTPQTVDEGNGYCLELHLARFVG